MRVTIDPAALAEYARSPDGDVVRLTMAAAEEIRVGASEQVGVSEAGHGEVGGVQQHLRDALIVRPEFEGTRFVAFVGADLPHAEFHHRGTDPHVIMPTMAKALRFVVGGVTVFAAVVNHPGTAANKYLTDPARRLGLRVEEY